MTTKTKPSPDEKLTAHPAGDPHCKLGICGGIYPERCNRTVALDGSGEPGGSHGRECGGLIHGEPTPKGDGAVRMAVLRCDKCGSDGTQ